MNATLLAIVIGFIIDILVGDPHGIPHPVVLIGKMIDIFEKMVRENFPRTKLGERAAGAVLWFLVVAISTMVPFIVLMIAARVHIALKIAIESIMCWQILATKSLSDESMKVHAALVKKDIQGARSAVGMIVGRDTDSLDEKGIIRATVETISENTSDGVVAPLLFLAIGGAPLGFLYKAVNTMDSMLGYIDPPYTNIGFVPAKMDDIFNFIPARLSALNMLVAGKFLRMDVKNGFKIFKRDRYKHASPNSAQTESVCAGLLGVRLAGNAYYRGVLHEKPYIGDELREIEVEDIKRTIKLLYVTALVSLVLFVGVSAIIRVIM